MGRKNKVLDYRHITEEAIYSITLGGIFRRDIKLVDIYRASIDTYPEFTKNDLKRPEVREVLDMYNKQNEKLGIRSKLSGEVVTLTEFDARTFYEENKEDILAGLLELEIVFNNAVHQVFTTNQKYEQCKRLLGKDRVESEFQQKYEELIDDFDKVKRDNIQILKRDAQIEQFLSEINETAAYMLIEKSYSETLEYKKYGPIYEIAKELINFDIDKKEEDFRKSFLTLVKEDNEEE